MELPVKKEKKRPGIKATRRPAGPKGKRKPSKRPPSEKQLQALARGRAIRATGATQRSKPTIAARYTTKKKSARMDYSSAIAAALIAPDIAPPVRLKTNFTDISTSVAHLFKREGLTTANSLSTTPVLGDELIALNQGFACIFRQVLRALIIYIPAFNAKGASYSWKKSYISGSVQYPQIAVPQNADVVGSVTTNLRPGVAVYASGGSAVVKPHGTYLWPGLGKTGFVYFWIDTTSNTAGGGTGHPTIVTVTGVDDTGSTATLGDHRVIDVTLWRYSSGLDVPIQTKQTSAATWPITFTLDGAIIITAVSGYYRISCTVSTDGAANTVNTTVTSLLVNVTQKCGSYGHRPLPNIDTGGTQGATAAINLITGARVNAAEILLQNDTPLIAEGGHIAGCQVGKGDDWLAYVTNSFNQADVFSTIASLKQEWDGPLAKGIWSFVKAEDESDFVMQNFFPQNSNYAESLPYFFIDDITPKVLIAFKEPSPAAGSMSGSSYTLRSDYGIEYTSDVQLFGSRSAESSKAHFMQALEKVSRVNNFNENPSHLGGILKGLGYLGGGAIAGPIGAAIGGALGGAAGEFFG